MKALNLELGLATLSGELVYTIHNAVQRILLDI